MKLVYTLSCGISPKKHKFFINMKKGAKNVIKMIYKGNEKIKSASIVQSNFKQNKSHKYIVIGSKTVNEKDLKHNYHEINLVTDEGLWNRYWQTQFNQFMEKYQISFKYLPMIVVYGYHFKHGVINDTRKYAFKINNMTTGIKYLKTNEYAQVKNSKGISKFLITDIVKAYKKSDLYKTDIPIKELHDIKNVVHVTNLSLKDLKYQKQSDLDKNE